MIAVSLVNHVVLAPTVDVFPPDPAYPSANVRSPQRPFMPVRVTGGLTPQIFIDFGVPVVIDVFAVIRTSWTLVNFRADDAPTIDSGPGGVPNYSSGTQEIKEGLNGRYSYAHRPPAPVVRRYVTVSFAGVPVATPPHPANPGYAVMGGVWMGPLATVPRDILMDPELERHEPVADTMLPSGTRARVTMGYPYLTLTARRKANQDAGWLDTELRAWLTLDRAWGEVDYALVLPRAAVAADAYIMRRIKGAAWTWSPAWSEGDLTLEEVTAG